jgi:5S rRNA maturation endonuclease (ribonuclease M5)
LISELEEVKNQVLSRVDIRQILQEFGISYKESGRRVVFSLREEKRSSCSAVFMDGCWKWRDFGDPSLCGTVIHLYNYLKTGECSFSWEAVKEIAEKYLNSSPVEFESSPSPLPVSYSSGTSGAVKVIAVLDDFLNKQKKYLKDRGVYPLPLSSPVYPVLYEYRGKRWYGLGIKTLSGGWVVRQTLKNEKFARYLFSGKADISFWEGMNKKLVVVEGMFDALSLRVLRKGKGIDNVIVLNSVVLCRRFLSWISGKEFEKVILALDNDKAGRKVVMELYRELRRMDVNVGILKYEGKDLNEFLGIINEWRGQKD